MSGVMFVRGIVHGHNQIPVLSRHPFMRGAVLMHHHTGPRMLRPTVFKAIHPFLFEVRQCRLTRAIIGRMHTEDSARQPAGFQAIFCLHQGFKGSQKSICC